MKRRRFVKTATAATVALTGCLGGDDDNNQQEVGNGPQGRFTVVRDSKAGEIVITVEDPMNSDHAAIGGSHTFDHDIVMEDIEEGSSLTLSVEDGDIEREGSLEIFAIRGDFETQEANGHTVIKEVPENYQSINDEDDNPFSYDFSDSNSSNE